ncbi:MAG: ABC transporter permease subunit [Lachnospiraceae bacterium]|uniref:ABC transporter permease subunit n=1 Tax=Candidatus Weimeria bifida TaxID=2599074 RepID=A0A6N7IYZ3_9FIRM|nr:ABC transporter permease subunit [Candidatus Weimeria bifida]RRF95201.1 MAG: ABC transporter permease subunit [Lachnospiraceae bacterium]
MFQWSFFVESLKPIIQCMPATLELTAGAVLLALALGIAAAILVRCRFHVVNVIFTVVNSFLKGIPILLFLYLLSSSMDGIMTKLAVIFNFTYNVRRPPVFAFAILALALSYIPYMCDMITTAYDTIPKGQTEACEALGFTKWQTMHRIIIPQMMVAAIPNFGNHFVNLLKATSLTCMITIMEMMGGARNFATMNQRFLEAYTACALLYWVVFIAFEKVFSMIEKRAGRYLSAAIPAKKRHRRLLMSAGRKDEEAEDRKVNIA